MFFFLRIFLFDFLTVPCIWCDTSSPNKDWTQALSSKRAESWPLDHQGSSKIFLGRWSRRDFSHGWWNQGCIMKLSVTCRGRHRQGRKHAASPACQPGSARGLPPCRWEGLPGGCWPPHCAVDPSVRVWTGERQDEPLICGITCENCRVGIEVQWERTV